MSLKLDRSSEQVSCTCSEFTDPKLHSTDLYRAFGKNEELLARSLAYIYMSCQRNKLIHPCLLPSLLLHSIEVGTTIDASRTLFCFLRQMFRIEFIFDPDSTPETVSRSFVTFRYDLCEVTRCFLIGIFIFLCFCISFSHLYSISSVQPFLIWFPFHSCSNNFTNKNICGNTFFRLKIPSCRHYLLCIIQ